jgi:hypothetical protein
LLTFLAFPDILLIKYNVVPKNTLSNIQSGSIEKTYISLKDVPIITHKTYIYYKGLFSTLFTFQIGKFNDNVCAIAKMLCCIFLHR